MFRSLIEAIFSPFHLLLDGDKKQQHEEKTVEESKYDFSTVDTTEYDEENWN